jgi:hypothetical protein
LDSEVRIETERFDELSFIDDDFAEQLTVVENELIDNYVRGELSGEKLESHHPGNPS